MSSLEKLHTTRDLAERYGRKPRAIARMASLGRWPSRQVLGEYLFTDEMVAWIDSQHERWPENKPAEQPKQDKPQSRKPRAPRTRDANPPAPASNVRPLVAKQPQSRRSA